MYRSQRTSVSPNTICGILLCRLCLLLLKRAGRKHTPILCCCLKSVPFSQRQGVLRAFSSIILSGSFVTGLTFCGNRPALESRQTTLYKVARVCRSVFHFFSTSVLISKNRHETGTTITQGHADIMFCDRTTGVLRVSCAYTNDMHSVAFSAVARGVRFFRP